MFITRRDSQKLPSPTIASHLFKPLALGSGTLLPLTREARGLSSLSIFLGPGSNRYASLNAMRFKAFCRRSSAFLAISLWAFFFQHGPKVWWLGWHPENSLIICGCRSGCKDSSYAIVTLFVSQLAPLMTSTSQRLAYAFSRACKDLSLEVTSPLTVIDDVGTRFGA